MQTNIILGLGYGDEGKGKTTAWLAGQSESPLVIRFSAGHQAGHTVVNDRGQRHVFSNFGSGTLSGAPTYWSAYCTFYPVAYHNERQALKDLGVRPQAFIDALAMVTTPYDIYFNRRREAINRHGSCGLGVGATMTRNQGPCKLYAQDLRYATVLEQKLQAIRRYYRRKSMGEEEWLMEADKEVVHFLQTVASIRNELRIVYESHFFSTLETFDQLIFEGTQGILLDMDHGFFPNVTYAYTTSRNAMDLIGKYRLPKPTIYYITRAYQTRHGNGFLANEHLPVNYHPNPAETNQYNTWQGEQRIAPLDVELIEYAIRSDQNYSTLAPERRLVITCLDQLNGNLQATERGQLQSYDSVEAFAKKLETPFSAIGASYTEGKAIEWQSSAATPAVASSERFTSFDF